MPLGAARLNTLSKTQAVVAAPTGLAALDPDDNLLYGGLQNISTNTTSAGKQLTVSYWALDQQVPDGEQYFSVTKQNAGYPGSGVLTYYLYSEYAGGRFRIISADAVLTSPGGYAFDYLIGTYSASNPSTGTYSTGGWNHFVFSCDFATSTKKVYVNGVSASTTTLSSRQNFAKNVWHGNNYDAVMLFSNWDGVKNSATHSASPNFGFTQLFVDNVYYNLDTLSVRQKFYNSGAVDMGTDGTASGLSQPLIFHTGNTTDFPTKGGDTSRFNYTLTTYRTGTGEADISTSDGPQFP
jgi:hypothetical protein